MGKRVTALAAALGLVTTVSALLVTSPASAATPPRVGDTVAWVTAQGGLQIHAGDGQYAGGRLIDPTPRSDEYLVAGDWNGDGNDTVAWVTRQGGLQIHAGDGQYAGGRLIDPTPRSDETLIAGDWDGDGKDTVAWVTRQGGLQIHAGDGPYAGGTMIDPTPRSDEYLVAGDWDSNTRDTVAWVTRQGGLQIHASDGIYGGGTLIASTPNSDAVLLPGDWNGGQPKHIVEAAQSQFGVPYIFGHGNVNGPTGNGFDCSGLSMYVVYQATGKVLPHLAATQFTDHGSLGGTLVAASDLQPGDLVFFAGADGSTTNPGHVGIYIGRDARGTQQMIDAFKSGTVVRIDALSAASGYAGAVRYWS
jgi:hypothetical protein